MDHGLTKLEYFALKIYCVQNSKINNNKDDISYQMNLAVKQAADLLRKIKALKGEFKNE